MSDWRTTDTPADRCPFCDVVIDRASGPGSPSPGDLSVCMSCASVLKFGDDMHIVAVSAHEFKQLDSELAAQLEMMQKAVRSLDRRNPSEIPDPPG